MYLSGTNIRIVQIFEQWDIDADIKSFEKPELAGYQKLDGRYDLHDLPTR